ncbi:hypothetical protein LZ30DRAFT_731610, partial [Colletotrichum cereale]
SLLLLLLLLLLIIAPAPACKVPFRASYPWDGVYPASVATITSNSSSRPLLTALENQRRHDEVWIRPPPPPSAVMTIPRTALHSFFLPDVPEMQRCGRTLQTQPPIRPRDPLFLPIHCFFLLPNAFPARPRHHVSDASLAQQIREPSQQRAQNP